jgi:hypothetical protein
MRGGLAGAVAILAAAVLVGGCGGKAAPGGPVGTAGAAREGTPIGGQSGPLEVKPEGSGIAATAETGSPAEGAPRVSEEEIGIAIYPGATVQQVLKQTAEDGSQSSIQVNLSTPEAFDKVRAFYQEKLPKGKVAGDVETPDLNVFQVSSQDDGEQKTVMVSRDKSGRVTKIMLVRVKKEAAAGESGVL